MIITYSLLFVNLFFAAVYKKRGVCGRVQMISLMLHGHPQTSR